MKRSLMVGLMCLIGLCFLGSTVDAGCRHCHKHKVAHRKVKVGERKFRKADKKLSHCNSCSSVGACSTASCCSSACSSACSVACACPDNCPCRVNGVCSCGPNCNCPECPSHKK